MLVKTPQESLYLLDVAGEIQDYRNIPELANAGYFSGGLDGHISDSGVIYASSKDVSIYDPETDEILRIDKYNSTISEDVVINHLDRDQDGNLWVGGDEVLAKLQADW